MADSWEQNLDDAGRSMMGLPALASDAGPRRILRSGGYDGASTSSRELALWTPPLRMADSDILPDLPASNARSRDLARNDGQIAGHIQLQQDTIVGSQYMLNLRPSSLLLFGKEDTKWEDEASEEIETRFTLWGESPDNWADAARMNSFTQLIRLAVGIHTLSGELLATVEWLRDWEFIRSFNTAICLVDLDRLSTPPNLLNDARIRGGVRKNEFGAPQSYFIRMAHPTDVLDKNRFSFKEVPIRKPWGRMQVLHILEQKRPDQTRGMAAIVAAIKETRMGKKYRDMALQNAVMNAMYAASIESELPTDAIFQRLGAGNGTMNGDEIGDAVNAYIGSYFSEISKYIGGANQLKLDGVKIPHLPPGSKLNLRPAGNNSSLGNNFQSAIERYIAAALGTSTEEFSRNFSETNYSGFKGALSVSTRTNNARKKAVADRFATYIFRCWFEEAFNKGIFETLKRRGRNQINIYQNQNLDILTKCEWIGASAGQVDELKETQAAVLRINAGLSTIQDEAARLGKDWRALMRQLARERDWKKFYDVLQTPVDTNKMVTSTEDAANKDGQNTKKDQ